MNETLNEALARNPVVAMYLRQVALGFGLAVLFTALLLGLDIGGLRHLVLHVEGGWLGAVLLVVFNGIVFAGAQMGVAVFLMAEDAPPAGGTPPGPGESGGPLAPARAAASVTGPPGPWRMRIPEDLSVQVGAG